MDIQKGRKDFEKSDFNKDFNIKTGTSIYELGGGIFEIQTNEQDRDVKNLDNYGGDFFEAVTMDDIVEIPDKKIEDSGVRNNTAILNYDKTDLKNYAYFGSLRDRFIYSITDIVDKFPASFLVTTRYDVQNFLTFINRIYDPVTDTTKFDIPMSGVINNYGISIIPHENDSENTNSLRNFYKNYKEFSIKVNKVDTIEVVNLFEITTLTTAQNPNNTALLSTEYTLKPNTQYVLSTNIQQTGGNYDIFFHKPDTAPSSTVNGVAVNKPRVVTTGGDGKVMITFRNAQLVNDIKSGKNTVMLEEGKYASMWKPAKIDMPVTYNENVIYDEHKIIDYNYDKVTQRLNITTQGETFPNMGLSGSIEYHVKPRAEYLELFKKDLDDLQRYLLSNRTVPKYTSEFRVFEENEVGEKVLVDKSFTWATSDGYNLDFDTYEYRQYTKGLLDLGQSYDDYKSNIIINQLINQEITDKDSEDPRFKPLLKSYGFVFDDIKRYIDGLAFIARLTYNKSDNIPDVLVKNYAKTLGYGVVNTFDENSFINSVTSTTSEDLEGVSEGLTPVETDIELWRRITLNLGWLFKTKGTRESIDFILRLIGAPQALIDIREYIYKAESKVFLEETYGLPVDDEGYPLPLSDEDTYFQMNGGWNTLRDVSPTNGSSIDSAIGIHEGEYDLGQSYIDTFRKVGFKLIRNEDNKKIEVIYDNGTTHDLKDSRLIINTKELHTYLTPMKVVEEDFIKWFISNNPTSDIKTIEEFYSNNIDPATHKVINYKGGYPKLKKWYMDYSNNPNAISLKKIDSYLDAINKFWLSMVEQTIPSTAIWQGGVLYRNNILDSQKHTYKHGINFDSVFETEVLDTPTALLPLYTIEGEAQPTIEVDLIGQTINGIFISPIEFPSWEDLDAYRNNILRIKIKNSSNKKNILDMPIFNIEGATHIIPTANPNDYRTIVDYSGGTKILTLYFDNRVYDTKMEFKLNLYKYSNAVEEFSSQQIYTKTVTGTELNAIVPVSGKKKLEIRIPLRGGEYMIKMGFRFKVDFNPLTEQSFIDFYKSASENGVNEVIKYLGNVGGVDMFEFDSIVVNETGIYGIYDPNDYWFSVIERPSVANITNMFTASNTLTADLVNQTMFVHSTGQRQFILEDEPQGHIVFTVNGLSLLRSNFIDYSDGGEFYVRKENEAFTIIVNEGFIINEDDTVSVIYVKSNNDITIANSGTLFANNTPTQLTRITDPVSNNPAIICYEHTFGYSLTDEIPIEQLIIQLNGVQLHLKDNVNNDYVYMLHPTNDRKILFYFDKPLVYNATDLSVSDTIVIYYPLPVEDGFYLDRASVRIRWSYYNDMIAGKFLIEVSKDVNFTAPVYMSIERDINTVAEPQTENYDVFVGELDVINDVSSTFYYRVTTIVTVTDLIKNNVTVQNISNIRTFKTDAVIYV